MVQREGFRFGGTGGDILYNYNGRQRALYRAYRKAGYLTMVIAGYIPANSQLAAAIATIVKSLSVGK